ncbi:MAG: tetratricopeptide repeat protein [Acidobacteriota bacterium]|nr:tetratricopeptide repeat protein [Acidobacteriota bacterium]
MNLVRSLELARKEFEVRHDIYTWDALGWALYKNGKFQEAAETMSQALKLHTKDAILFFHAGMIYQALGQNSDARDFLVQALAINPRFHVMYSGVARQQLAKLDQERLEAALRKKRNAP